MTQVLDSPIPTSVDVSIDVDESSTRSNCSSSSNGRNDQHNNIMIASYNNNPSKLNYDGTNNNHNNNNSNTSRTATQFSSPLGLFAGEDCAAMSAYAAATSTVSATSSSATTSNTASLDLLYIEKKTASILSKSTSTSKSPTTSPTPNLVAVMDHDSGSSDGDNLWQQLKLVQQQQQKLQHKTTTNTNTASLPPSIQPLPSSDNIDRLIHQQTSEGHYLVNSRPLDSPMAGLKYSLTKGKKAMSPNQRRASVDTKKTRPNAIAIVVTQQAAQHTSLSNDTSAATTTTAASITNKLSTTRTTVPSFKIFLLLIQPKSKIFEIIQVFYAPSQTTIQNILEMIPVNATEPALGSQKYVGICRPKDGQTIHLDTMATTNTTTTTNASSEQLNNGDYAKIVQGEILVAIPEHYSGSLCSKISQPILANPKVTKLLTRSDPLAPRKSSRNKHRKKKKHRVISIETVKEETESLESPSPQPARKNMKESRSRQEKDALRMALQHAAREAASTNAQVMENNHTDANSGDGADSAGSLYSNDDDCDIPVEMWKTTMSLKSRASTFQRSDSMGGDASTIASFGESANSSFCGNQSVNSLDTNEYQYKRMPRRSRARASTSSASARRQRRKKQLRIMAAVVLVMVVRYVMVGRVSNAVAVNVVDSTSSRSSSSMFGLLSLLQVGLAFFAFVKTQRYLEGRGEVQDCSFCQFVLVAWRKAQST